MHFYPFLDPQAYMRQRNCSLSKVDNVVYATPNTLQCTNAGNLTVRGCTDLSSSLLPSAATSDSSSTSSPETSSRRRKRGAAAGGGGGGGGQAAGGGAGGLGAAPALVDAENIFLYYYMSMDSRDRMMIGHQFQDTIKACSFRGKDCAEEE